MRTLILNLDMPIIIKISPQKQKSNLKKRWRYNSSHSGAYKQLGNVFALQLRKEEALAAYKKWQELDPGNADASHTIGYQYNGMEKYELAIEWLQKANAIKPAAITYLEIGFAYYKLKKSDEAIAAYKKALEIDPGTATAYKGMGDVYRLNYNPAKTTVALENYEKAISLNPKAAGAYYGIGWCYNEEKNYAKAITALQKAQELDAGIVAVYTELGYAQYMTSSYADATRTFNKGIEKDSRNALCHYYLGLVHVMQKDKANAQKMYDKLVVLNPGLAEKLQVKITAMQ